MAVKFISYVDEKSPGDWFIKLTDTLGEKDIICNNLDEYQKNLEEMADDYGNEIEVVWNKSKTLSIKSFNDLSEKMEKLKEEYSSEIDEINQPQNNEGFNPNE